MIVITTPTGQIGSKLLATLRATGAPVRVIARDPSRIPAELADGVEIIRGSHGDAAVVDAALAGAEALFWNIPSGFQADDVYAHYVDFTRPAADAIRRHRVGRVVAVSSLGRGYPKAAGLVSASIAMTGLLDSTGAATRALASPGFMDNLLRSVATIRDQGVFFGTIAPDRRLPHAATADIAAVAAELLSDDSWGGNADVPVLGPEDLSFDEVAAICSDVLGRAVRYQQISLEDLGEQMLSVGASASVADAMVTMMAAKDDGSDSFVTRTPANSTPTSFRQWAEQVLKPAVLA